jgi:hypothetical protein
VCRLANDVIEQRCNLLRCIGRDWHIASIRCTAKFDCYWGIADIPTSRLMSRNPRIAMKATTERCLGTAAAKMDRCPPKLEGFVGGAVQTPIGSRAVRVTGASFA